MSVKAKKLILFVISFKGGVGKTTFSRALVSLMRRIGISLVAYDCDAKVGQLAAHEGLRGSDGKYDSKLNDMAPEKGVPILDIRDKNERLRIADALDLGEDTLLFDLPGGSVDDMKDVFGDIKSFKQELQAEGYEICIALVINQLFASAAAIPEVVKVWGSDVTYLVIKNSASDDSQNAPFLFYDGEQSSRAGNPGALIEGLGGKVMTLPRLADDTYALIDADQMSFEMAKIETMRPAGYLPAEPYGRAHRGRMRKFLSDFEERVRALNLIPGLDAQGQPDFPG